MNSVGDQYRIDVNEHIYLSALTDHDTSALIEFLNDQDIYKNTLRIPYPYTAEHADAFLQFAGDATERHGHPVHFAIRDENGQAIGGFGFDGLTYGHRAEIGYWLGKPFWGRGIMTAVVGAMSEYAVEQWKLVRITAHVFDFNAASARVLDKNGFHFEGLLRKHHRKDGAFIDSRLYALVH